MLHLSSSCSAHFQFSIRYT